MGKRRLDDDDDDGGSTQFGSLNMVSPYGHYIFIYISKFIQQTRSSRRNRLRKEKVKAFNSPIVHSNVVRFFDLHHFHLHTPPPRFQSSKPRDFAEFHLPPPLIESRLRRAYLAEKSEDPNVCL